MNADESRVGRSALVGAAFLMATSAIGPGFLTQTAVFTGQLGASFGFAILASVVIDLVAQLAIWRTVVGAGRPAQDVANSVAPGLGTALALLVALGGLAFNIGNVAGAASVSRRSSVSTCAGARPCRRRSRCCCSSRARRGGPWIASLRRSVR